MPSHPNLQFADLRPCHTSPRLTARRRSAPLVLFILKSGAMRCRLGTPCGAARCRFQSSNEIFERLMCYKA
uniref:Uncharacterized protein n=1 Tax=Romanomermis culicivorax TaxID=13658 RepID=A0A915L647_ROMCU